MNTKCENPSAASQALDNQWALPDDVFLAGAAPEARFVDLKRGRFYALDPIAHRMVEIAITVGDAWIGPVIGAEFDVPGDEAKADWAEFRNRLQAAGLLVPAAAGGRRSMTVRAHCLPVGIPPSRRAVWFLVLRCWACLRVFGWARTVRWLRAVHPPAGGAKAGDPATAINTIDTLVRLTAAEMLVNPECKERAVAAWHLLRTRYGLPAQLVVGIRLYPFEAHAWVECDGRFVTDDEERCTLFTPVAAYD